MQPSKHKKNYINRIFYGLGIVCVTCLIYACGSSDHKDPPPQTVKTATLQITLGSTPDNFPLSPQSPTQITIKLDGQAIVFSGWSSTKTQSVDISKSHTLAPQPLQFQSGSNNIRCGAKGISIAADSMAENTSQAHTIVYTCTSTTIGGSFTQSSPELCSELNGTYNADLPTQTVNSQTSTPYYHQAGLLVHIIDGRIDRQLMSQPDEPCNFPDVCGSIFYQKPPHETKTSSPWPPSNWAFSYIQKSLKAQPGMTALYNADLLSQGQLIYGIIINTSTTNQQSSAIDSEILCSYPRDGQSDSRALSSPDGHAQIKNPCGSLDLDKPPSQPEFYEQNNTADEYANTFFQKGFDVAHNFPPFKNDATGFNTMVRANQIFSTLPPCDANDANSMTATRCNSTCNTNTLNQCSTFNEIDIQSKNWDTFLKSTPTGSKSDNQAISAVFVLCSNATTSQIPCTPETLQSAEENIKQSYGQATPYPLLQHQIPMVLLDIEQLTANSASAKTDATTMLPHGTAAPKDNGPFSCHP